MQTHAVETTILMIAVFTTMSLNDCYRHIQSLNNDHFKLIRREGTYCFGFVAVASSIMAVADSVRLLVANIFRKGDASGKEPSSVGQ